MRQYQGTRIHICVGIRGLGYIYASVSEDQDKYIAYMLSRNKKY